MESWTKTGKLGDGIWLRRKLPRFGRWEPSGLSWERIEERVSGSHCGLALGSSLFESGCCNVANWPRAGSLLSHQQDHGGYR